MKNIQDFKNWCRINESENSEILSVFSSIAKAVGSAMFPAFSALIALYEKIFDKKPERISLIFPKEGWEEKAVKVLKKIGVVTGVFKSTEEAINSLKVLKDKGIKAKELVIGSHGDGKTLLITQKEDTFAKKYTPALLDSAKQIIQKDTKVFFTACHGADYLMNLVDSANRLGIGVYGSRGIYNYVTNSSEKGYYYCRPYKIPKPKKVTDPRDEFYSGKLEMKPTGYEKDKDYLEFQFFGPFEKKPEIKIEFKVSSFSKIGWNIKSKKDLSFILNSEKIRVDEEDYGTKEGKEIYEYTFNLSKSDFLWERSLKDIGFNSLLDLYGSKDFKWSDSKTKNFGIKLKNLIKNGDVTIKIGEINLAEDRSKMRGYHIDELTFDNNKHLLECGACKKVQDAPISWISPA